MQDPRTTETSGTAGASQAELAKPGQQAPVPWWNHEDFPYSAPWWLRYPASVGVFAGAYWCFFEWEKKAGWALGVLLAMIGLGLVRELFLGALLAVVVGLVLWALGAAVAALPVSIAIIIGAMIIAQAMRR
jgi:hypothetical protein